MLPSFHDLASFIEVSQCHNLSRASERLGMTQPALTQAMKRLESHFGQPLLVRSRSGVNLTKAGQKLAPQARMLLDMWKDMVQEASKDQEELRGHYVLGIHSSVALYTTSHFIPQLLRDHPQLELEIYHDLSRRVTESVVSFKLDFALAVNPTPHPDLIIKELFKDEVCFFSGKKKSPLNDLSSEKSVLIYNPELTQTQSLLSKFPKSKLRRSLKIENLDVIARLTAAGSGIGIIPRRVAAGEGAKLKALTDLPSFTDKICLLYRADLQKGKAAKGMGRFIYDKLKDK